MKSSSSGEPQQEAYEVLPTDLAFADMNLNYAFFSQSGGEGRQFFVFPGQLSYLLSAHSSSSNQKCHSVCHYFQNYQDHLKYSGVLAFLSQYSS